MNFSKILLIFFLFTFQLSKNLIAQTVIRYNLLGYTPKSAKWLVTASKNTHFSLKKYQVKNTQTGEIVFSQLNPNEKNFGAFGPFKHSYRINLSKIEKPGNYVLVINDSVCSGPIRVQAYAYEGSADFCLRFMRQQRSGFNPFTKDSCHQDDGYTLYGPMPDSSYIDVAGGWHNASNYLQYVTTSANATWHLLAAHRDFPIVFTDKYTNNGLEGINGLPDILDEARWGLTWLEKMHPEQSLMFHQIADDRDNIRMRLPTLDSQYGRGYQRPVYFVTGKPQGSEKYKNRSNGSANIAGKFSSAFALGAHTWQKTDDAYANYLKTKALSAYHWGQANTGVCQTAPQSAPYFYEEENWADDMELAAVTLFELTKQPTYQKEALEYAGLEPITPWLGADTAHHYQWYPFANPGHVEIAKNQKDSSQNSTYHFMQQGIEKVWKKAEANAFYHGVPFICCSNNLTVAIATQCYWYRTLYNNNQFEQLEQACFDWIFGCNPWGTSMVYGLPEHSDTPTNPYSAFTQLAKVPIDGGLFDGPVYTSIYKNLIGIPLTKPNGYTYWQSNLAVYPDDYGNYSTNEQTLDGTASLIYLLAAREQEALMQRPNGHQINRGAIIRADSSAKKLALVFAGHEFAEGGKDLVQMLNKEKIKASFFLTGDFLRNFPALAKQLKQAGHYIGPHSNKHLLYAPWYKRDSLLVSKETFDADLNENYQMLKPLGITEKSASIFLPPYQWYNDSIASWTAARKLTLINNTPGTLSEADFTTPDLPNYKTSDQIYLSILQKADQAPYGLNGYFLLMHLGVGPTRTDKFYYSIPLLVQELKQRGYQFLRADELLGLMIPTFANKPLLIAKKISTKGSSIKKRKRNR